VQRFKGLGQLYGIRGYRTGRSKQARKPSKTGANDFPLRPVGRELYLGRRKFGFCFLAIVVV
jgi:hypothetical protein